MLTRRDALLAVATAAGIPGAAGLRAGPSMTSTSLRSFEDDISGQADANGNVTMTWPGMRGQFAALLLIAQASGGSPSWVLKVNGSPVNVGRGLNSPLRLPILRPGDKVALVGTGLQSLATTTGHFVGLAADNFEELPIAPPEPSTIALDSATPVIRVGDVTAPVAGSQTKSFPVPTGTIAIGFLVNFSGGNANPTQVQVLGDQSLTSYLNVANPTGGGPHAALFGAPLDRSVSLIVNAPIAAPSNVILLAWTSQAVVVISPNIEAPVPVTFFSASNALLVAQPAPWQAPKNRVVTSQSVAGGGGSATVLAAQGGVQFFLHAFSVMNDGSNAAGVALLQDTTGGNVLVSYTNATRQVVNRGSFFGLPLTQGAGVNVINQGVGAEFFGVNLAYNQQ